MLQNKASVIRSKTFLCAGAINPDAQSDNRRVGEICMDIGNLGNHRATGSTVFGSNVLGLAEYCFQPPFLPWPCRVLSVKPGQTTGRA